MLRWHSAVVLRHHSIAMLWWLTELMLMMLVVVLPVTRLDHDRSGRFYGRYLKPAKYSVGIVRSPSCRVAGYMSAE